MSYFSKIRDKYGNQSVNRIRSLTRNYQHLAELQERAVFLSLCNRYQILPRSLRYNLNFVGPLLNRNTREKLFNDFRFSILKKSISNIHYRIAENKQKIKLVTAKLYEMLPLEEIVEMLYFLSNLLEDKSVHWKNHYNQKFAKLSEPIRQEYNEKMKGDPKWLANLSDVTIPDNICNILSLGEKFSINTRWNTTDYIHIISQIEAAISKEDISINPLAPNGSYMGRSLKWL